MVNGDRENSTPCQESAAAAIAWNVRITLSKTKRWKCFVLVRVIANLVCLLASASELEGW